MISMVRRCTFTAYNQYDEGKSLDGYGIMKSLEQWVEETTLESLPVLRRTVSAISRMSRNYENLTATDIAEVVLHDPLMTLKVIGLVNFKSRGRFGAGIVTAQGAIIMLGVPPFFKVAW